MTPTLTDLLDALTIHRAGASTVDEMDHSGGAGVSFVERWPVTYTPIFHEAPSDLYLWRVMWIPRRERGPSWARHKPVRIAFGVTSGGEPAAQKAGRAEARRLAKQRRTEAQEAA
jgi:hypothetical protein